VVYVGSAVDETAGITGCVLSTLLYAVLFFRYITGTITQQFSVCRAVEYNIFDRMGHQPDFILTNYFDMQFPLYIPQVPCSFYCPLLISWSGIKLV